MSIDPAYQYPETIEAGRPEDEAEDGADTGAERRLPGRQDHEESRPAYDRSNGFDTPRSYSSAEDDADGERPSVIEPGSAAGHDSVAGNDVAGEDEAALTHGAGTTTSVGGYGADEHTMDEHATDEAKPIVDEAVYNAVGATSEAGAKATARADANAAAATDAETLFGADQSSTFRTRWHEIQAAFVDDPGQATSDADRLVTEITQAFTAALEDRRGRLAAAWQADDGHETEQLRLTMRQYRGLVDQLLDHV